MEAIYPWMPKQLNPNSREHYQTIAKYKKIYKTECWAITKKARLPEVTGPRVHLDITFVMPDKRRRDLDNCLSSFKAGLDGIRDGLEFDDHFFDLTIRISDKIGGFVAVQFDYY